VQGESELLNVKTPEEVKEIINKSFPSENMPGSFRSETVGAAHALGRVLGEDVVARDNVPGFNRSTVDGYAVLASDTHGSSESIPALLRLAGEVQMGESAGLRLISGACVIVSTGGEVPEGADAVVIHEFTEDYGNSMIGICKPAASGSNIIFYNDDTSKGDIVLSSGKKLSAHDIGILSALGYSEVVVRKKPVAGVISTGDELVPVSDAPKSGQVRDVNTPMLLAALYHYGAEGKDFGIIKDDEEAIRSAMLSAVESCDIVLISGGSSAGLRDMTADIIGSEGELLLHGIAMKPGKPTILGKVGNKPVFGLPGHPVAAYMVTELFIRPLIANIMGATIKNKSATAKLSEAISSNHGREEYIPVKVDNITATAIPVKGKSGLISGLADIDGYICIPRDCEGLPKGSTVTVYYL